ncbi:enoyl-CoA hydratase/isomerase family protein [Pseudonocardia spinosispora]|uniref:enoyl-CoA hydratase/isomerase family protein n=1 Tax=Pseudonocardia spinosispora TaxID=103441 RepID=UPI00048B588A|nr:enoyl-CoA hydratase/isomerase family protein [Pseudonocardia spinosispora]
MTSIVQGPVVLERDGDVSVLRFTAGENRFNQDTLSALEGALDEVEQSEAPTALVITGDGKFFSNGLDLAWLGEASDDGRTDVLRRVHGLLGRVLAFPTATVAAINGHAFAAGAMLALACDFRVMRADRGFVCLPEVDLGLPFTGGMNALLRGRLTPTTATRAMVFGERFAASDALALGLVDHVVAEAEVLSRSVALVAPLAAKQRHAVKAIKRELHRDALAALEADATTVKGF